MNTSVNRAKPTALGKQCNPNCGPSKHWKWLDVTKRAETWLPGTENIIYNLRMNVNTEKKILTPKKGISSIENGCINMN